MNTLTKQEAERILKSFEPYEENINYYHKEDVLRAMEEYAQSLPSMRWVKCSEKLPPKFDAVCRKMGCTDILDSADFHLALGYTKIKIDEWEWLSESTEGEDAWVRVEDAWEIPYRVIVAYKFGVMEAVYYNGIFAKDISALEEVPEVTHFMHLPKPPVNK
jgi:hypothetical protein